MKAHLMFRDRDFDMKCPVPAGRSAVVQDLELDSLFVAMGGNDKFVQEAAKAAALCTLEDPEAIMYRQRIVAEALRYPEVIRSLYAVAMAGVEESRKVWRGTLNRYPDRVLYWSMELLRAFMAHLRRLRNIAEAHAAKFQSEGLSRLLHMLSHELDDAYLASVEAHLKQLKFPYGLFMSAELGEGNRGLNYALRTSGTVGPSWIGRLRSLMERLPHRARTSYVYEVPERDESGANAMAELKNRGISAVASMLAQSADHVQNFFEMLRTELAFYVGSLNLADRLAALKQPVCLPEVLAEGTVLSARNLYDAALALTSASPVVGNDVRADGKALVMITGANRGGKSTGLRSIGQAQVMMQCGMFVAAASYRSNICSGIFTHFKREEDVEMRRGKLDEELARMSEIVDQLKPRSLILFNESFASTNPREGSEIASDMVRGLLEAQIKVIYVTHLFDLAYGFYLRDPGRALFLRAERLPDGQRTFRLLEGVPLLTSHGEDLYRAIFSPSENLRQVQMDDAL
jgi:hypothetical protein